MSIPVVYNEDLKISKHEEILMIVDLEKNKKQLNMEMVLVLFKILYKQGNISKNEYEKLILNTNRTFNLKQEK